MERMFVEFLFYFKRREYGCRVPASFYLNVAFSENNEFVFEVNVIK